MFCLGIVLRHLLLVTVHAIWYSITVFLKKWLLLFLGGGVATCHKQSIGILSHFKLLSVEQR